MSQRIHLYATTAQRSKERNFVAQKLLLFEIQRFEICRNDFENRSQAATVHTLETVSTIREIRTNIFCARIWGADVSSVFVTIGD